MSGVMEELDHIVDCVERELTSRIEDLNNGEVEYVVKEIISRFENHLNRLEAARQE